MATSKKKTTKTAKNAGLRVGLVVRASRQGGPEGYVEHYGFIEAVTSTQVTMQIIIVRYSRSWEDYDGQLARAWLPISTWAFEEVAATFEELIYNLALKRWTPAKSQLIGPRQEEGMGVEVRDDLFHDLIVEYVKQPDLLMDLCRSGGVTAYNVFNSLSTKQLRLLARAPSSDTEMPGRVIEELVNRGDQIWVYSRILSLWERALDNNDVKLAMRWISGLRNLKAVIGLICHLDTTKESDRSLAEVLPETLEEQLPPGRLDDQQIQLIQPALVVLARTCPAMLCEKLKQLLPSVAL